MKRYSKSKLLYFFFGFWSGFWYPMKCNCLLFVNVVIIVGDTNCFLFKVISYLLQCFLIISIFSKHISQILYFSPKYFSEHILAALARNPLNMLVIVEHGLICTFVRAGLRWTSNSYLPLLFFVFIFSKKFKHFSSSSSSITNWMCLPVYLKSFEIRETVL